MKRNSNLILISLVLGMMAAALTVKAQDPTDPNLVYVHVTATDSNGRYITELHKDHFKVWEDNVPQAITYFSDRDIPISVAILLDVEGSTKDQVRTMALSGLTKVGGPRDEFFVIEAGDVPLNAAVYQSLQQLLQRGNDNQRALAVFTTKNDPSAYSFSKVKELLRDQDVRLYVTAVPARAELAAEQARSLLKDLAALSGGDAFFPQSILSLEGIFRKIGTELRSQYLIGYRPSSGATDGKWRKIKVTAEFVDNKQSVRKTNIRTKPGYYAPAAAQQSPAQK